MTGSSISLIICVAAIWMAQRLLTTWQALRYRKQLMSLRDKGRLSVGLAKKIGRRVYVGLTFDDNGIVTDGLVLRGITVFAVGRAEPDLIGTRAVDLAAGRTPPGLKPMVATATTHSASFVAKKLGTTANRSRRRVMPAVA